MRQFFSTGEFAKLCKVNKQTLIYYEQLGLMRPVYKNEQGYRYYSVDQLELFSAIELLKNVGMSLADIRTYLQQKSPERYLALMHEKQAELARKREELERQEQLLARKIAFMEAAATLDFTVVSLVTLPPTTLYISRDIENIAESDFVQLVSAFIAEIDAKRIHIGAPIGGMSFQPQIIAGNYTNYRYLYIEQAIDPVEQPAFEREGGQFLVGYHLGTEATIHETYARLFAEMERRGLQLGHYSFEEYVYDMVVRPEEEQYVTKVMIHAL